MKLRDSTYAQCPFYKGHIQGVICCEGPVEGSVLRLSFASCQLQADHRRGFCEKMDYGRCPVARMLEAKYEGG